MSWLWSIVRYLSDLAGDHPWTSWIMHAVLAVPIAWAFGATTAVVFYGLREAEQVIHRKAAGVKLDTLDRVMDVLAPALAAALTEVFLR